VLEVTPPEQDGDDFNDWHYTKPPPTALWNYVETDSAGRFEIRGLQPRHYKINVLCPEPLAIHTSAPIPAGAIDERIRLEIPGVFPEFKGRVLTDRGVPVPNARVRLWLPAFDQTTRVFGGHAQFVMKEPGEQTRTDEEGRFTLHDVPKEGVRLGVGGDDVIPRDLDVGPDANPEDFVVHLWVRCHVQVDLDTQQDRADSFAVFDEEDERIDVMVFRQGSTNAYTSMNIVEGRSQVVSVSSRAATLVLIKDGQPVERIPLDLVPGEVNLIRR
jgi:hypothetical protein